jgi:hypothetical protein
MMPARPPIPLGSVVRIARKAESTQLFGELLRQRYASNIRGTTLVTTITMRMRCSTGILSPCAPHRQAISHHRHSAARRTVALDRLAPPMVGSSLS